MKSKKILTILLSLAIMFTFMPAMAFASTNSSTQTVKWDSTYSNAELTLKSDTSVSYTYPATKAYSNTAGTGWVQATASDGTVSDSYKMARLGFSTTNPETARFYDLDGAKLSDKTGGTESLFTVTTYSRNDFMTKFGYNDSTLGWISKQKSSSPNVWGLQTKNNVDANSTEKQFAELAGWTVEFDPWAQFDVTNTGAQTIQVPISVEFDKANAGLTIDATEDTNRYYECKNADKLAPVTITIAAANATPETASFYFDGKTNDYKLATSVATGASTGTISVVDPATSQAKALSYDGSAFTLKMVEAEGLSVKYQVLKNGVYVDTDEVSVTDKAATATNVKAIVTKGTKSVTYTMALQVTGAAGAPTFDFNDDVDFEDYKYDAPTYDGFVVAAGEEYDPMSFIKVYPHATTTQGVTTVTDADKAATAANAEELKKFFADFYTVEKSTKAAYPDFEILEIKAKKLTGAERATLANTYKQLISNLGLSAYEQNTAAINTKVSVYLKPATQDYEVTFTKAIASKTYKGSKTTKKGKLKKNQTIQFAAEASNGKDVKYKLINVNTSKITINSTTGKVTLKKGLAKGTYKFKVKAYVPGNSVIAYEVQNVTIKVKK